MKIDWRSLSEKTNYKILTTPSGETISSDLIAAVILAEANIFSPRRVIIDVRSGQTVLIGRFIVREDVDDFFKTATEAHRRAVVNS